MRFKIEVYAESEDLYPKRANPTDAGFDLYSSDDVEFQPGERLWVPTGVALRPELKYYARYPEFSEDFYARNGELTESHCYPLWDIQVRARGSMWGRGFNTHFGTGDGTFNCEYKVGLEWTGKEPITIKRGERIAQIVFHLSMQNYSIDFERSEEPFPKQRGWHGSSGK